MFRRAVFALLLIGAAFAGGAAINGPGLVWVQRNFLGGPSIIVDPAGPNHAGGSAPRQFPTAKASPLEVDLTPSASKARPKAAEPGATELALADAPPMPESSTSPASALAPLPKPDGAPPEDDPPVPPLPSEIAPASPPEPATLPRLDPPPKADPVARLASVEPPATAPSPATAPGSTWPELRKRMKDLGVVRYTIEGETEGRVKFRCVIPVEGLKAVSHHFEAEGDDATQAAEAALKRIALWKATAAD